MKGKVIRTLCIILILLLSLCQIIPVNVSAIGDPVVQLRWDDGQEVQHADVEPGEPGTVSFTGTASADLQAGGAVQDVRVELRVTSEHGWDATVTPAVFMINPGTEEKAFEVVVRVPPETSTSVDAFIIVSGTATAFPGSDSSQTEVPPITGSIIVTQYFRYIFGCNKPYIQSEPGEEVQFELFIGNQGNARDTYVISVPNLDDLVDDGFDVSLDRETIEVPEKGNGSVIVTVQSPEAGIGELADYKKNIEINVRSTLDPEITHKTFVLTIKVESGDILESENIITYIIVIIVVVICIILLWRYRKKKKEL